MLRRIRKMEVDGQSMTVGLRREGSALLIIVNC